MTRSLLTIALVSQTARHKNVMSNVSKEVWDKLKRITLRQRFRDKER